MNLGLATAKWRAQDWSAWRKLVAMATSSQTRSWKRRRSSQCRVDAPSQNRPVHNTSLHYMTPLQVIPKLCRRYFSENKDHYRVILWLVHRLLMGGLFHSVRQIYVYAGGAKFIISHPLHRISVTTSYYLLCGTNKNAHFNDRHFIVRQLYKDSCWLLSCVFTTLIDWLHIAFYFVNYILIVKLRSDNFY